MKRAAGKFFSSKVSGIVAGTLVVVGCFTYIFEIRPEIGGWDGLVKGVVIIFSLLPAFFGLLFSLLIKPGRDSNSAFGLLQILVGLWLAGATPTIISSFISNYMGYTSYWVYSCLSVFGGIIFVISGFWHDRAAYN